MYAEYKNVNCTQSIGIVHVVWGGVQKYVRLYTKYKFMIIIDTDSSQPYPFAIPLLFI